jgi:hypothetical protein
VTGDPREAAEVRLLAKLSSLTTGDGLPQAFGLVTRQFIHAADLKSSDLPACFVQMTADDIVIVQKLSHVRDVELPGRIVVGFSPTTILPSTIANAYRHTIDRMIEQDFTLGGLIDACYVTGELQAGLWAEIGLLGIGVLIKMIYEYDARLPAIAA